MMIRNGVGRYQFDRLKGFMILWIVMELSLSNLQWS